ncbi:MAG: NUDIX domain-containing protein [Pseudomonadales bacterium]|nr:NUDIX domain-containing protein [Pseudomonadales bacterium]
MSEQDSRPTVTRIGSYGVIEDGGKMLLCRLSENVRKYQGWWTLPGGGLEFGEHPEEGMIREVEEETGLIVRATSLLGINSFTIAGEQDDFHSIQIIYSTEVVGGELRNEIDGTTDLCQWHAPDSLESISVVELVERAIEYSKGGDI